MINDPLLPAFRNREATPYTDPSHPIHAALITAAALDVLDQSYSSSDMSEAALAAEALLLATGEAAGGLSTDGFRADLLLHVTTAERDEDEAIFEMQGWRGFYDANREPCRAAYQHGCDVAKRWSDDVAAALVAHGYQLEGGAVIPLTEARKLAGPMVADVRVVECAA